MYNTDPKNIIALSINLLYANLKLSLKKLIEHSLDAALAAGVHTYIHTNACALTHTLPCALSSLVTYCTILIDHCKHLQTSSCWFTVWPLNVPFITVAALKLKWLWWFWIHSHDRNTTMSMVRLTQLTDSQLPVSGQGISKKKEAPCHQHETKLWSHLEATADSCWSSFQCGSSKFSEECQCLFDYSFFFISLGSSFLCAFVV